MSDADGLMSPELAEQAIWGYYWQLAHSRDRRRTLTPTEVADLACARIQEQQTLELDLWARAQRQIAKWFTRRNQEAAAVEAQQDALAELEAKESKVGKTNHATGLPESPLDLEAGRAVISGEALCMNVLVPPYALAASVTAWLPPGGDPNRDSDWQVMAYKAQRKHCHGCSALGRLPGSRCTACKGEGRRRTGLILSRQDAMCEACQGHGSLPGPTCEQCGGKGVIDNWTQEEHDTVNANSRMVARTVEKLAKDGYFQTRPINKQDAEMGDLTWEDDEGCTIGFKLTWQGFKRMQEYMDQRPDLKRQLHTLVYAGEDVRDQAPGWAQEEYRARA